MTLPVVPGSSMSFSQINTELGLSSTATISLNDAAVRTLAGVGASPATISITNLSGKANQFAFAISANQTNANLRTLAVNAGWNQSSKVVATINGGIYISSNGTGTPALTVDGSFPGGVELINNGFIIGMGGNGGAGGRGSGLGGNFQSGSAGSGGGLALSVSVGISINNAGTIGGGGGGGGGGCPWAFYSGKQTEYMGGGGGGGGRSSNAANTSGGAGGFGFPSGAAGGTGTVSSAGGGGAGGNFGGGNFAGPGGSGGGWGSGGSGGSFGTGQAGGSIAGRVPGGASSGGGAVSGNGNITWIAFGTRLGGIS